MSVPYLPLEAWNKRWTLDGSEVRCLLCGSGQNLTQAGAFHHGFGCKARTVEAQYPSRELATVLQEKIRLGLF
ncbi:hypothetical protein [Pseudomonas sp. WS 5413]|uniref:hypothetical protein n=1 Tax=Pseudomonas sp. WS 5413 TaxID=2717488 RepID=UPI001474443B|nr:hypothetical protein [Pseudomonas sp. WS 5413]NMX36206.1 hypothetical protein [Pseudomonas sp. WS 5413]